MGDGTAFGVVTGYQSGVIKIDQNENFPIIPKKLLGMSPKELRKRYQRGEGVIYDFALTVVLRKQEADKLGLAPRQYADYVNYERGRRR